MSEHPTRPDSAPGPDGATESFLQAVLRTARDGFWVTDDQLRLLDVNEAYCRMSGYSREELLQLSVPDLEARQDVSEVKLRCARIRRVGSDLFETSHRRQDGSLFEVEVSVSFVATAGGRFVAFFRDITGRKQAERALRDSRQTLEQVLDTIPQSVFWKDRDLRYLGCNRVFAAAVGKDDPARIVGLTDYDLPWPREEADAYRADDGEVIARNRPKLHILEPLQQADGTRLWIDTSKVPLRDASGRPYGVLGVYDDVTERKRAEEALRESETRLRALSDNIPDGFVYQIEPHGSRRRFTHVSAGVERILGVSRAEILADPGALYGLVVEEDREPLAAAEAAALAGMAKFQMEVRFRTCAGEVRWHLVSSTPRMLPGGQLVWDGVAIDITERRRAEEERLRLETRLNQAQKLDALGIMAGGIAHDFNNLLTGIFGCVEMALPDARGRASELHLAKALDTMDRARSLTQQLLTFAKGGTPIRRTGSVAEVAEETVRFALSGSNVTARFALPPDTWPCDFDRHQVGQVIDNLVINAQQAMPDGGTIELRARNVELGPDDHASLPPGPYVRLSLADHGVGMPREILPRIFDPFYTTKPRGHGLGLATCYSIVHRHGGAIDVESEPGRGSVFHLWLPATPGATPAPAAEPPVPHVGRGAILVMDDEDVVREVTAAMLSELGYEVLQARDGAEAIAVFTAEAAAGRRVAGLIFDLTIPGGMSGRDALAEVRKLEPEVPVFVSSGYAADPVLASPADYGFTASIAKPFRLSELAALLQAHLPGGGC